MSDNRRIYDAAIVAVVFVVLLLPARVDGSSSVCFLPLRQAFAAVSVTAFVLPALLLFAPAGRAGRSCGAASCSLPLHAAAAVATAAASAVVHLIIHHSVA